MKRFRKKEYGKSKTTNCPFCGKISTHKNEEGIDVCRLHTKTVVEEIKCTCGSWLEPRSGKFGPYYNCFNCGNVNYNKAREIRNITQGQMKKNYIKEEETKPKKSTYQKKSKEITLTTDDLEYFS